MRVEAALGPVEEEELVPPRAGDEARLAKGDTNVTPPLEELSPVGPAESHDVGVAALTSEARRRLVGRGKGELGRGWIGVEANTGGLLGEKGLVKKDIVVVR